MDVYRVMITIDIFFVLSNLQNLLFADYSYHLHTISSESSVIYHQRWRLQWFQRLTFAG